MRISDWSSDVCSSDLDKGAHAADVILPAAAWTEKNFTSVNTVGRVQRSDKAVFAPGDAREDWSIFRALADALGVSVGFDSFAECRAAMVAAVPALRVEGDRKSTSLNSSH